MVSAAEKHWGLGGGDEKCVLVYPNLKRKMVCRVNRHTNTYILVLLLSLLLHIFQKIKVSIMGMFYTVRTGYACHGSGELPVSAVLVGKPRGIKDAPDFLIFLSVIAPFKPGLSALYVQPQVNRPVLHRYPGVEEFRLYSVFQMDDG